MAKEVKSWSTVAEMAAQACEAAGGHGFQRLLQRLGKFHAVGVPATPSFKRHCQCLQGETKEHGFNFSAFNDKLFLRVNRFETKQVNVSYNGAANVFGATVNIRWICCLTGRGRQIPTRISSVCARRRYRKLFSLLPPEYLSPL